MAIDDPSQSTWALAVHESGHLLAFGLVKPIPYLEAYILDTPKAITQHHYLKAFIKHSAIPADANYWLREVVLIASLAGMAAEELCGIKSQSGHLDLAIFTAELQRQRACRGLAPANPKQIDFLREKLMYRAKLLLSNNQPLLRECAKHLLKQNHLNQVECHTYASQLTLPVGFGFAALAK